MNRMNSESQLRKPKCIIGISSLLIFFAVISIGVALPLTTRSYRIASNKVSEPIRLMQISDLHSCIYGDGQRALLEEIKKQAPDVILFSGDIADDEYPHDGTVMLLSGLQSFPMYYVTGNHEFWSGEVNTIKEMFRAHNVIVLENEASIFSKGNASICIGGVDDPAGGGNLGTQIRDTESGLTREFFSVLLSHRPEYISTYESSLFDLVLSGHAHGGQWRIPGLLNGLLAPNQGLFPKYAGGMYSLNSETGGQKHMIVSRGLAKETTRIPRFYNPPELVVIDIMPARSE